MEQTHAKQVRQLRAKNVLKGTGAALADVILVPADIILHSLVGACEEVGDAVIAADTKRTLLKAAAKNDKSNLRRRFAKSVAYTIVSPFVGLGKGLYYDTVDIIRNGGLVTEKIREGKKDMAKLLDTQKAEINARNKQIAAENAREAACRHQEHVLSHPAVKALIQYIDGGVLVTRKELVNATKYTVENDMSFVKFDNSLAVFSEQDHKPVARFTTKNADDKLMVQEIMNHLVAQDERLKIWYEKAKAADMATYIRQKAQRTK